MKIQQAVIDEYEQIQAYDRHIPPERLKACMENGWIYILKEDAGHVVGVLRYSLFWQTIPFLDLLFLDEQWRGQGFGRQMMTEWEQAMRSRGYAYCMLSTQEDETAKDFYQKLGYEKIGAFLPPEQPVEEWIYQKAL